MLEHHSFVAFLANTASDDKTSSLHLALLQKPIRFKGYCSLMSLGLRRYAPRYLEEGLEKLHLPQEF
ncbi:hypothetical protein J6590_028405 [Homalodisca vitripennis]|nr:hypothetical protein J6590_028405 [Homalodisca vitripennis]